MKVGLLPQMHKIAWSKFLYLISILNIHGDFPRLNHIVYEETLFAHIITKIKFNNCAQIGCFGYLIPTSGPQFSRWCNWRISICFFKEYPIKNNIEVCWYGLFVAWKIHIMMYSFTLYMFNMAIWGPYMGR